MKTNFNILLLSILLTGFVHSAYTQILTITKWPVYIPAGNSDSSQVVPFAVYLTLTGSTPSVIHYLKIGSPGFADLSYQLFTYRNSGPHTGTWGRTTSYSSDNFTFQTDPAGAWEGWIPLKAQKSGITQISARCRPAGGTSNINSPAVSIAGMISAGSGAGFLVGNLLDGNAGSRENKAVLCYHDSTLEGIWFSEPDSMEYSASPPAINEMDAQYSAASGLAGPQGGYALLVRSGPNSITKIEVCSYSNNVGSSAPLASRLLAFQEQPVTIPDSIPITALPSTVGTAADITLYAEIPDGSGSAALASRSPGLLNGSAIFGGNAAGQSVEVTVMGIPAGSLDQVRLTVPPEFTQFVDANVSLGGAFTGKSPSFSGKEITVLNAGLGTSPGSITIAGLTSPSPVGPLLSGDSKWKVETSKPGGALTEINFSPHSYTLIPISNIRTGGADGHGNTSGDTSEMSGQTIATSGVITVENGILRQVDANFVIQSGLYALEIFRHGEFPAVLVRGDSVIVKGVLTASDGASQIVPATFGIPDFFVAGTAALPPPLLLPGASAVGEASECLLIRLNGASYDSAGHSFIASAHNRGANNFHTQGGDSGTVYLSPSNQIVGCTIPSSGNIIGIALQRNSISGGGQTRYKVAPRDKPDIGLSLADGSGEATISPAIRLAGAQALRETLTVRGDGSHTIAGVSATIPTSWTWSDTALKTISGPGFGSVSFSVSGDGSPGGPYVITVSGASVTDLLQGRIAVWGLGSPQATGITAFITKTMGTGGVLTPVGLSPAVSIVGAFEAVSSGNWNSPGTWSGGIPPTQADDVSMATRNVIVTLTGDAACRNLTMSGVDTSGGAKGPELRYAEGGATSLSVNGKLELSGMPGRPKLTSNGNGSATLVVKGNIFTNVSNATANGDRGLNMNEGTVKLTGASADTLKSGAGFRLSNLIIGDGISPKRLIWNQSSSAAMNVRSITIKSGSSFICGTAAGTNTASVGNHSTAGLPMLTGGLTVENAGSFLVSNTSGGGSASAFIYLKGGGITNNGELKVKSPDGSRKYHVAIGGLPADPSPSSQTLGGMNKGAYANIAVGQPDTLFLSCGISVDTLSVNGVLSEAAGGTATGIVTATRSVAKAVRESFGGIGIALQAYGAAPGLTTVTRATGSSQTGGGAHSILRMFDIVPAVKTGLNASLDFSYDTADLAGEDPSTLQLWKSSNNGITWIIQPCTVDSQLRRIHAEGIASLSRWTASDRDNPLGLEIRRFVFNHSWNMVSVPLTIGDYSKTAVFPSSVSPAFLFANQYLAADTLKNGAGYWLKFGAADTVAFRGLERPADTVSVREGWNMIGSLSQPVLSANILQIPPGIVISSFFTYLNSYTPVDTILPCKAYWVKTSSAGQLVLSQSEVFQMQEASPSAVLKKLSYLSITDAGGSSRKLYFGTLPVEGFAASYFELPPAGPLGVFDLRFGSQRFAETFPPGSLRGKEYPILIRSASYPLRLAWHVVMGEENSFALTDSAGSISQALQGDGWTQINRPPWRLSIVAQPRGRIPLELSLSANYPNPFNPFTKFLLAVPERAYANVAVYDMAGRKVRTFVDGEVQAGYHTLQWDGLSEDKSAAPSGVYFIRLIFQKSVLVRKIMMLR